MLPVGRRAPGAGQLRAPPGAPGGPPGRRGGPHARENPQETARSPPSPALRSSSAILLLPRTLRG